MDARTESAITLLSSADEIMLTDLMFKLTSTNKEKACLAFKFVRDKLNSNHDLLNHRFSLDGEPPLFYYLSITSGGRYACQTAMLSKISAATVNYIHPDGRVALGRFANDINCIWMFTDKDSPIIPMITSAILNQTQKEGWRSLAYYLMVNIPELFINNAELIAKLDVKALTLEVDLVFMRQMLQSNPGIVLLMKYRELRNLMHLPQVVTDKDIIEFLKAEPAQKLVAVLDDERKKLAPGKSLSVELAATSTVNTKPPSSIWSRIFDGNKVTEDGYVLLEMDEVTAVSGKKK